MERISLIAMFCKHLYCLSPRPASVWLQPTPVQYNGFLVCCQLFFHFHSFFSYIFYKKKIDIPIFVTGILSGLVGITGKSRVRCYSLVTKPRVKFSLRGMHRKVRKWREKWREKGERRGKGSRSVSPFPFTLSSLLPFNSVLRQHTG